MGTFKINDKVICLSKPTENHSLEIGKVYTIAYVDEIFINLFECSKEDYYLRRFKKIDDNAINKLLYSEAFGEV